MSHTDWEVQNGSVTNGTFASTEKPFSCARLSPLKTKLLEKTSTDTKTMETINPTKPPLSWSLSLWHSTNSRSCAEKYLFIFILWLESQFLIFLEEKKMCPGNREFAEIFRCPNLYLFRFSWLVLERILVTLVFNICPRLFSKKCSRSNSSNNKKKWVACELAVTVNC